MVANAGGKKLSSLPFPAIVGQEELKRVLLAVAANDGLDGALITGEKGTAKSTAVRALVDLLPEQRAVADCPYGCSPDDSSQQCDDCRDRDPADLPVETRPVPLVTLPLGATRDRVVGTLSVEDALAGEADFDPGLLARANRGILYVDEVNLLDDHLVDVILDSAASGINTVERDGISVSHPADFTLIGTMNPEEGDLRPQLRDRFALQATVEGSREIDDRVEIIDRALEGESDPDPATAYADEVDALREELAAARERLSSVDLPADFKAEIADLCLAAGVDGHRGDVATARTAMTLAALEVARQSSSRTSTRPRRTRFPTGFGARPSRTNRISTTCSRTASMRSRPTTMARGMETTLTGTTVTTVTKASQNPNLEMETRTAGARDQTTAAMGPTVTTRAVAAMATRVTTGLNSDRSAGSNRPPRTSLRLKPATGGRTTTRASAIPSPNQTTRPTTGTTKTKPPSHSSPASNALGSVKQSHRTSRRRPSRAARARLRRDHGRARHRARTTVVRASVPNPPRARDRSTRQRRFDRRQPAVSHASKNRTSGSRFGPAKRR